jgi:aspartokinase-like uncharacterized kinase
MSASLTVVKIGGSLYDLPDLAPRLQVWLKANAGEAVLLVPGGGGMANVVRKLDHAHGLGEERAHWLALRALSLNAHFLAGLLPLARVIDNPRTAGGWAILDCHAFALADECRADHLPHTWAVTSDSIAARAAHVAAAQRLVLLKSVTIPDNISWGDASRRGWVDAWFEQVAGGLTITTMNLRSWPLA